jgi:very-short-patch-repair endonuclease
MADYIRYNPKLTEYAKKLRKQGVLSEVILWHHLKKYKTKGLDFHRQKPIDNYIVNFYCPELRLVIEIDGISHAYKINYDEIRQKNLETAGLTIIHFSDSIIKQDINSVLRGIEGWIKLLNRNTPRPSGHPSQEGN